jgi:hypothetical protein
LVADGIQTRYEEGWLDFDALGMLQQLGVVPPPGAAQFSRQLPVD